MSSSKTWSNRSDDEPVSRSTNSNSQQRSYIGERPLIQLLLGISFVGVTWLVGLPRLAQLEPIAQRLEWLDAKRIDPSAMFYTELESMEPILERLNAETRAAKVSKR